MADEPIIIPVNFKIIKATHKTIEKRGSNHIIGPGYASHVTGAVPEVNLSVIPSASEIKTRELIFRGYCSLQSGDMIKAYIHKYNLEEGESTNLYVGGKMQYKQHYIERDFIKSERISKLEKIGRSGELLAEFNGLDDSD